MYTDVLRGAGESAVGVRIAGRYDAKRKEVGGQVAQVKGEASASSRDSREGVFSEGQRFQYDSSTDLKGAMVTDGASIRDPL